MMFRHSHNIPHEQRCCAMIERDTSFEAYLKGLPQGAFGRAVTKCLRKQLPGSRYCWQHKRIYEEIEE